MKHERIAGMLLTENQIAANPTLVQDIKDAAAEQATPMSPEKAIQHLRDISRTEAHGKTE